MSSLHYTRSAAAQKITSQSYGQKSWTYAQLLIPRVSLREMHRCVRVPRLTKLWLSALSYAIGNVYLWYRPFVSTAVRCDNLKCWERYRWPECIYGKNSSCVQLSDTANLLCSTGNYLHHLRAQRSDKPRHMPTNVWTKLEMRTFSQLFYSDESRLPACYILVRMLKHVAYWLYFVRLSVCSREVVGLR